MRAEIIAIGDELTCGYRLDTNSRWISEQLSGLGVSVAFHTTMGDELGDVINGLETAASRAEMIVCTGGLGPTADDLTRQAVATMANVELEFDSNTFEHIRKIFGKLGRTMPEQNNLQAYFPAGSHVIPNSEGTAPGFDLLLPVPGKRSVRIWALPGVPYEMKEMWTQTVAGDIAQYSGNKLVICHHVLHCFGAGESQVESMLPDLMTRDRIPRVGITASKATISLRVTASAANRQQCLEQMGPTLQIIRDCLGDLVFGENGQQLQEVVIELLRQRSLSVAIIDFGFGGSVAPLLNQVDDLGESLVGSSQMPMHRVSQWLDQEMSDSYLETSAHRIRDEFGANWGVAIGPVENHDPDLENGRGVFDVVIADSESTDRYPLNFGGHSELRWDRSQKQVLNQIRLRLLSNRE